jgi:pimeloyl-ACP methyl ester carboxylesterase
MPQVQVNNTTLFYQEIGSGEPLLLIAGFACDHTIWGEVAVQLSSHYRVISMDNRGTGQSTGADRAVTIRQMADDAAGLLAALGLSEVHIAGHSMGGLIAQELALSQPKLVHSLSLVSSCAQTDARGRAVLDLWGELPMLVDPVTMTRILLPWMYTSGFYSRPGAIDKLMSLIMAHPYPPSADAIYGQSRAISSCTTIDRLGQITCPTLVLAGSDDILLPVGSSKILARGITGAELVILEKTGHVLLIETPEAVAKAMLEFLKRIHWV